MSVIRLHNKPVELLLSFGNILEKGFVIVVLIVLCCSIEYTS